MARTYHAVCPRCGEIHEWCKFNPPIDECDLCERQMTRENKNPEELYDREWREDVLVFGIGTLGRIEEASRGIRKRAMGDPEIASKILARRLRHS